MIECRERLRIPVELPVFFSRVGNAERHKGTLFDISAGGCAVTSMMTITPGTDVTLVIQTTDLGSPITIHSAQVRWASHGEFGMEFLNLSELDRNRLGRLLHIATPRSTSYHESPVAA